MMMMGGLKSEIRELSATVLVLGDEGDKRSMYVSQVLTVRVCCQVQWR